MSEQVSFPEHIQEDVDNIQVMNNIPQNMITDKVRAKIVIFSFFALLIVELFTKKMNLLTPSYHIKISTDFVATFFVNLGQYMYYTFDVISSYCSIKDLAKSSYDLLIPLLVLPFSPYETIHGMYIAATIQGINDSFYTIITGMVAIAVLLTIIEINSKEQFKPSSFMVKIKKIIKTSYRYFGCFISDLSSIYRVLKLEQFFEALVTILHPFFQIIIAPIKSTCIGYYKEIEKYRYGHLVIGFGSLTLIFLVSYGYSQHILDDK